MEAIHLASIAVSFGLCSWQRPIQTKERLLLDFHCDCSRFQSKMGLLSGGCYCSRFTRSDASVSVLHPKRLTNSKLTGVVQDPSTLVRNSTTVDWLERTRTSKEEVRNSVLSIRKSLS